MTFVEWCLKQYGITGISQAKIINYIFFAGLPETTMTLTPLIKRFDGRIGQLSTGLKGLIIPKKKYLELLQQLDLRSNEDVRIAEYFAPLGIDSKIQHEHRELPKVHISGQLNAVFFKDFNAYVILRSWDPYTAKKTLTISANILDSLKEKYDLEQAATSAEKNSLQSDLIQIEYLQDLRRVSQMSSIINAAHRLSLDYSNKEKLSETNAGAAYAVFLTAYVKLNMDNLSDVEYCQFNYAYSLINTEDRQSHLPSLIADASFTDRLKQMCCIRDGNKIVHYLANQLPLQSQQRLRQIITDDAIESLYGSDRKPRFIPDQDMNSDINELIFQAGGRAFHSAIFRIIKRGVLADGQPAKVNERPHHYQYYKIEHNLGAGNYKETNLDKMCQGTVIKQLMPVGEASGELVSLKINPFENPHEYQKVMETTLLLLIEVERWLLRLSPHIMHDTENDWTKYNKRKIILSGLVYDHPLYYFVRNPLDAATWIMLRVENQREHIQEGGSCTIFSINALVSSICSRSIMTMFSHFMQKNNDLSLLSLVDKKIASLEDTAALTVELPNDEKLILLECLTFFINKNNGINIDLQKIVCEPGFFFKGSEQIKIWYNFLQDYHSITMDFHYSPMDAVLKAYHFQQLYFSDENILGVELIDLEDGMSLIRFTERSLAYLWDAVFSQEPLDALSSPGTLGFFHHDVQGPECSENLNRQLPQRR